MFFKILQRIFNIFIPKNLSKFKPVNINPLSLVLFKSISNAKKHNPQPRSPPYFTLLIRYLFQHSKPPSPPTLHSPLTFTHIVSKKMRLPLSSHTHTVSSVSNARTAPLSPSPHISSSSLIPSTTTTRLSPSERERVLSRSLTRGGDWPEMGFRDLPVSESRISW